MCSCLSNMMGTHLIKIISKKSDISVRSEEYLKYRFLTQFSDLESHNPQISASGTNMVITGKLPTPIRVPNIMCLKTSLHPSSFTEVTNSNQYFDTTIDKIRIYIYVNHGFSLENLVGKQGKRPFITTSRE